MNYFGCVGYYFLDHDNPGIVTPGSFQLYNSFGGGIHGEWQSLLLMNSPVGHLYYGLITGGAGLGGDYPLALYATHNGSVVPVSCSLVVEAPTAIPAGGYVYDWTHTQAWTWKTVGTATITLDGLMGGCGARWMPQTGPGVIPLDLAPSGAFVSYLRLRVVAGMPVGVFDQIWLDTTVSGPRNPMTEGWAVVLR